MSKADLFADALAAGLVPSDSVAEDFTVADLEALLAAPAEEEPAWDGTLSSPVPVIAPDGHPNLSADDLAARDE